MHCDIPTFLLRATQMNFFVRQPEDAWDVYTQSLSYGLLWMVLQFHFTDIMCPFVVPAIEYYEGRVTV